MLTYRRKSNVLTGRPYAYHFDRNLEIPDHLTYFLQSRTSTVTRYARTIHLIKLNKMYKINPFCHDRHHDHYINLKFTSTNKQHAAATNELSPLSVVTLQDIKDCRVIKV